MSKCEEGISLVELVHEQHEEIVILKAERDRYRNALIKIRGDGQGAIWQDIVREIDAALQGDDE